MKSPVRVPATKNDSIFSQNLNHYQLVTTKKSYYSLIKALLKANIVSYDLETQSNSPGKQGNMEDWHPHSRVVTASYTIPDVDTWVVPLSHPEGPWTKVWRQLFTNCAKAIMQETKTKIIAHNAKYEGRWTYSMTGIPIAERLWWDTMMSAYLLDENLPANLKDTAVRDLGVDEWADVDLRNSEGVPLTKLALYNARDTDYAHRLVAVHRARLEREPRLVRLFVKESMPLVRTLASIEKNGMPLDIPVVKKMQVESKELVEKNEAELLTIAIDELGMDLDDYPTISFGSTNKFFTDFMELSEFPVVSYTDTGNPSWTADNLEVLVDQGIGVASKIAETRKHANRQSKFFTPWLQKISEDGRLHPSFNPMLVDDKWDKAKGTKTGRLSSSNPNAQQIARDLKICFGGRPGWLVIELDYSQVELRIAAWLADVKKVIQVYKQGGDLHTLMASRITGKKLENIDGDERQKGKAGNFGFLYDMGEQTYVTYARDNYKVNVTLDEARKTRRAFFDDQWPGLSKWHDLQRTILRRNGYVRNPLGRKRRLPGVFSTQWSEISRAERQAINFPIQSFSAELMCLSLIEVHKNLDPEKARIIGTVHDSLLAEVREDAYQGIVSEVASIMLDPGVEKKFGVKVGVPLAVEAKVGYHWSDPEAEVREFLTN